MRKEYDFTKARYHKGSIVKKSNKIQKTFWLDEDVFEWLVKEAEIRGIPYQTLMNSLLKQMMHGRSSLEERVSMIESKLNLKKSGWV
jgi:predicted DNA binding CopG/RHH family protein